MSALPRSARVLRVLVAVTCSFPVVQACGGRSDTEEYLFGADGPVTVAGSSGSGAGGTRMGGGGAGAVAGRGNSAGAAAAGPLGGNVGVAGRPGVAGSVSVAGSHQGGSGTAGNGSAGNGSAGAAGSPPGSPITCGEDVCDASTQSCCAGLAGLNCVAHGQTCNGAVLGCTTNADCGVDICCISTTGDVSDASSCKPRCDSNGTGRDRQLCQVDADCRLPFRFCTPTIFGVKICTRRPSAAP